MQDTQNNPQNNKGEGWTVWAQKLPGTIFGHAGSNLAEIRDAATGLLDAGIQAISSAINPRITELQHKVERFSLMEFIGDDAILTALGHPITSKLPGYSRWAQRIRSDWTQQGQEQQRIAQFSAEELEYAKRVRPSQEEAVLSKLLAYHEARIMRPMPSATERSGVQELPTPLTLMSTHIEHLAALREIICINKPQIYLLSLRTMKLPEDRTADSDEQKASRTAIENDILTQMRLAKTPALSRIYNKVAVSKSAEAFHLFKTAHYFLDPRSQHRLMEQELGQQYVMAAYLSKLGVESEVMWSRYEEVVKGILGDRAPGLTRYFKNWHGEDLWIRTIVAANLDPRSLRRSFNGLFMQPRNFGLTNLYEEWQALREALYYPILDPK